jgi:hypothetical protein
MNNTELLDVSRSFDDGAQEIKSEVSRALVNGIHATFAIERLNRARKLESIASSIRSLCQDKSTDVKPSSPSLCTCEGDNDELIQPFGRGGLSY